MLCKRFGSAEVSNGSSGHPRVSEGEQRDGFKGGGRVYGVASFGHWNSDRWLTDWTRAICFLFFVALIYQSDIDYLLFLVFL